MRSNLKLSWLVAAVMVLAFSAAAQRYSSERRATLTGGGGDQGKCTIEVDVDGTAEVEISGDRGYLRTLSGQESYWKRLECTSPLPRNAADFQFKGIDGRGRVEMIRDPRNSGGRAVVRIDDAKGGREGYTFDLLWRGGDFGGNRNGVGGYGGYDRGRDSRDSRDTRDSRGGDYRDGRDRRDSIFGQDINFNGRGDGSLQTFRSNDQLTALDMNVRDGNVSATFRTRRGSSIHMTGRVTNRDGNRLTANVSGNGVSGTMFIDTDGGRVRNVSMTSNGPGRGRNFVDLRWHD